MLNFECLKFDSVRLVSHFGETESGFEEREARRRFRWRRGRRRNAEKRERASRSYVAGSSALKLRTSGKRRRRRSGDGSISPTLATKGRVHWIGSGLWSESRGGFLPIRWITSSVIVFLFMHRSPKRSSQTAHHLFNFFASLASTTFCNELNFPWEKKKRFWDYNVKRWRHLRQRVGER